MKNHRSNTSFVLGFSAVFLLILELSIALPTVFRCAVVAIVGLLTYQSWAQARQIETLRLSQAVSAYAKHIVAIKNRKSCRPFGCKRISNSKPNS